MKDDLGIEFLGPAPQRVVSLVPSTTEAVALAAPGILVGATDYCTHPAGLEVRRIGGSKYPDLDKVLACRPDLVLANAEENRLQDVQALREAGVAVWVSFPHTVPQALRSLGAIFTGPLDLPTPAWIPQAASLWSEPAPITCRAVIPIWRKPWMVLGNATFAGDVLRRLGITNVFEASTDPYPKTTVADIMEHRPDLVIFPDEPYEFTATDGPGFFPDLPYALVSGRHLTWHGPSLVEAHRILTQQLRAAM